MDIVNLISRSSIYSRIPIIIISSRNFRYRQMRINVRNLSGAASVIIPHIHAISNFGSPCAIRFIPLSRVTSNRLTNTIRSFKSSTSAIQIIRAPRRNFYASQGTQRASKHFGIRKMQEHDSITRQYRPPKVIIMTKLNLTSCRTAITSRIFQTNFAFICQYNTAGSPQFVLHQAFPVILLFPRLFTR